LYDVDMQGWRSNRCIMHYLITARIVSAELSNVVRCKFPQIVMPQPAGRMMENK